MTPFIMGDVYFVSGEAGKSLFRFFKRSLFGGFAFLTYLCDGR